MPARPALFPEPDPDIPPLSRSLAEPAWRLRPGESAKWTRISVKTLDCRECAHLQHERRGDFGPRRQAKRRRTVPGGGRLDLCHAHAQAWQQRDQNDSAPPKGAA